MSIIRDVLVEKLLTMTLSNNSSEVLKNISSATVRTLSKDKNLSVEFIEQNKKNDNAEIISINDSTDRDNIRGEIDLNSFTKRYLINDLYQQNSPNKDSSKKIYKLIHDSRSIVIGMNYFPGGFNTIKYLLNTKKMELIS